jgi:hypothetical protein
MRALVASLERSFGALKMKAFKDLFRDISGAEYAIGAAVAIVIGMIVVGTDLRSTSNDPRSRCCDLDRFEAYRGLRA